MSRTFMPNKQGDIIKIPATSGMDPSVHIIDEDSILAINAAIATGRPLLVRGEPGTGKSQLARAAAAALGRAFLSHSVDGRTETRDLLYSVDAVARLATAQVVGAVRNASPEEALLLVHVLKFIEPGPLWWAFDWDSARKQAHDSKTRIPAKPPEWTPDRGVVVLVDEIDKADAAIPNGLLDALGHGRFDVPGRDAVAMSSACLPLIVMTTNEERSMPDAFLRRCLVLHLCLPDDRAALIETLKLKGRAHFAIETCADAVLQRAAELLAQDREDLRRRDLAPPGLAEYIDLLHAVTEQRDTEAGQLALLEVVSKFAYKKHPPELLR